MNNEELVKAIELSNMETEVQAEIIELIQKEREKKIRIELSFRIEYPPSEIFLMGYSMRRKKKMNEKETKKEEYKLLKEGVFNDAHPFFKGLLVKAEKVGDGYMITVNEGRTWANLYANEEACMKVFNRMTKKGGEKNA